MSGILDGCVLAGGSAGGYDWWDWIWRFGTGRRGGCGRRRYFLVSFKGEREVGRHHLGNLKRRRRVRACFGGGILGGALGNRLESIFG